MKRIFRTVGILLLCGALLAPVADAQTRGRNNSARQSAPSRTHSLTNRPATAQPGARPGNSGQGNSGASRPSGGQPGSQPGARPGNSGQGNSGASRPSGGQPGSQPGARPGNSGQGNSGANRPSPGQPGGRPGNAPGGPIGNNGPGYRPSQPAPPPPGRPGGPGHYTPAPPAPWRRPTPPPSWRPPTVWRPFTSILGVTLGTTINLTINSLINSGYVVSRYGNNTVVVANVPMLNLMWPDAVLYYNTAGGLCGSRFVYSSGFYDLARYNSVYASLTNVYGAPYSVENTASGIQANWWGTNNQFITLSFAPQYTSTGGVAYYTTLSFGI